MDTTGLQGVDLSHMSVMSATFENLYVMSSHIHILSCTCIFLYICVFTSGNTHFMLPFFVDTSFCFMFITYISQCMIIVNILTCVHKTK